MLAVEEGTRKILAVEAAQMPVKGLLAKVSRRKYGYRADHRPAALRKALGTISKFKSLILIKRFGFSVTAQADIFDRINERERSAGGGCAYNIMRELAR